MRIVKIMITVCRDGGDGDGKENEVRMCGDRDGQGEQVTMSGGDEGGGCG